MTTTTTGTTTTNALSLSTLSSGLDTTAITTALVNVARLPEVALQSDSTACTTAATDLGTLSADLSALQSAATALSSPTQYGSMAASSDSSSIVATANGAAKPGNYTIDVISLAHETRAKSSAFSDSTSAQNQSGNLGITIGGTTTSVAVASTDSLTDIATNINKSGARVSASVIYNGSSYNLVVKGLDTGAANAVTFSEDPGVTLGLSNPTNTYQQATDAHIKLDGSIDITRSSNLIRGAIDGVSLALTSTTASTSNLTISSDTTSLTNKVQAFVNAYNTVVSEGHLLAGYGTTAAADDKLAGDSTIRSALDKLSSSVTAAVTGATGSYNTLYSIGVGVDKNGVMSLDSSTFLDAVQSDPDSVSRLFVSDPASSSTGAMKGIVDSIDGMITGSTSTIQSRITAFNTKAVQDTDDAASVEKRALQYQAQLQDAFTNMELVSEQYKSLTDTVKSIDASLYKSDS